MNIYTNNTAQFPGLDLLPMRTAGAFWRKGEDKSQLPDRDYFIEQCQGDGPLCINVEHWRWDIRKDPHTVVDSSLAKLSILTRWANEAFPGRWVGHYSLFPLRDYWTPQSSKLLRPLKWRNWLRANAYAKKSRDARGRYDAVGLADLCHVVMPSLYTFYENQAGWVKYAKANIVEARKHNKPVIPFLWPRYHPGGTGSPHYQGIPGDYWRLQLETLAECDVQGIVIWDAAKHFHSKYNAPLWTGDEDWIKATQEYV